jgi:AraC-like DNA-binding protein
MGKRHRPRVIVICPNVLGGAKLTEVLAMRFSVIRTSRPSECLWELDHRRPDAVVVDLSRLDTDVVCLSRTVLRRRPGCPVIGLGNAEAGRAVLTTNLFLSAFFDVPVDANALLDRLSALIGGARGNSALSRLSRTTLLVIDYLGKHYADRISLHTIGKDIGVSMSLLAHRFRAETGLTVMEFLRGIRIEAAKEVLASTDDKLEGVAAAVGFCDAAHLSRVFRRQTGKSPGAFRDKRCAGQTLRAVAIDGVEAKTRRVRHDRVGLHGGKDR